MNGPSPKINIRFLVILILIFILILIVATAILFAVRFPRRDVVWRRWEIKRLWTVRRQLRQVRVWEDVQPLVGGSDLFQDEPLFHPVRAAVLQRKDVEVGIVHPRHRLDELQQDPFGG